MTDKKPMVEQMREAQAEEIERRKSWTQEEWAEYNAKRARQRKALDELRDLYDDDE